MNAAPDAPPAASPPPDHVDPIAPPPAADGPPPGVVAEPAGADGAEDGVARPIRDDPNYRGHRQTLVGAGMPGHEVDAAADRGLHPAAILNVIQEWQRSVPEVAQIIRDIIANLPARPGPRSAPPTP